MQSQQSSGQSNRNNRYYKTQLCRYFEKNGICKNGDACQFAHGVADLREPAFNQSQRGTMHLRGQPRGNLNQSGFTTSARGNSRGGYQAHQQNTRGGFKYAEYDFPDEEFKIGPERGKGFSYQSQQTGSSTSQGVVASQINQQILQGGQMQSKIGIQ
jgi:hypothetical protein